MSKNKNRKNNRNKNAKETISAWRVREAIEQENGIKALELAKQFLKENPGSEAESLLAEAYNLRINQLRKSGLVQDARNLIEIAKTKCPNYKSKFDPLAQTTYHFPLTQDDVVRIGAALNSSSLSKENENRLHSILSIGLGDPSHLANCPALPPDFPLKQEAAIIQDALRTATDSTPDNEREQIMQRLSAISRRSPLAYWSMFVRALDAYHKKNDDLALSLVRRIPQGGTLSHGAKILIDKIQGKQKPDGLSSHATRALWKTLTAASLNSLWREILHAIDTAQHTRLRDLVKQAYHQTWVTPFIAREITHCLFQNMMNRAYYDHIVNDIILEGLRHHWGEKAQLYFQLALFYTTGSLNSKKTFAIVEESLEKYKKLLSTKELAAIYGMAAQFAAIDENDDFCDFDPFSDKDNKIGHDESIQYYKKACRHHPAPIYFAPMVCLMEAEKREVAEIESTLLEWSKTNPDDCNPLILLFEKAEKRNALQKALKFLERAEKVDPLDPKVRDARRRLVWRTILKHLEQKNWRLVQRDLQQIDLNQLSPLQKAVFEGVARFVSILDSGEDPGPGDARPVFSALVLRHLNNSSRLKQTKELNRIVPLGDLDSGDKLEDYYNLRDILFSLGDSLLIEQRFFDRFPEWIYRADPISEDLLLRISQTNHHNKETISVVMASTARGLAQKGARLHEFFFYRAIALIQTYSFLYHPDVINCLKASFSLCRARGDYEFAQQVATYLNRILDYDFSDQDSESADSSSYKLTDSQITTVLLRELKRTEPKNTKKKSSSKRKKSQNSIDTNEQSSIDNTHTPKQEMLW